MTCTTCKALFEKKDSKTCDSKGLIQSLAQFLCELVGPLNQKYIFNKGIILLMPFPLCFKEPKKANDVILRINGNAETGKFLLTLMIKYFKYFHSVLLP